MKENLEQFSYYFIITNRCYVLMLFFFHFFTGIVMGFLIADLLHDRRWVIPFIIGAVIPDLIDKTLGYFILVDVFGNGRIFMHGLLISSVILVIGFVIWKRSTQPAILALGLGILSHQILDLMWLDPRTWYYPLLGKFHYNHVADYGYLHLLSEVRVWSEWIFAILILFVILLYLLLKRKTVLVSKYRIVLTTIVGIASIFLFCLSGITIGIGLFLFKGGLVTSFRLIQWNSPSEIILGGIVFLMCSVLLWRMKSYYLYTNQFPSKKE